MSQQSVTLKIKMDSPCSEADLYNHLQSFIQQIRADSQQYWFNKINTDWEKSYPVEIEIEEVKGEK